MYVRGNYATVKIHLYMNGMTFMETLACVARKVIDRFVFNYLAADSAGQTPVGGGGGL